jgi:mono/diheme cytochrome c family protein
MKKKMPIILAFALIGLLSLSACGGGASAPGTGGGQTTLDRPEPPAEYVSLVNPHANDSASASQGDQIFQTNCSVCHGAAGAGDGPTAAALNPAPENLGQNEEGLSDGYLFWRIAEGGMNEHFQSAMPPWKGVLTDDQIWQVVTFIRTLD